MDERARAFYAETYDVTVPDWPDEIPFYRGLAHDAAARSEPVLELACGTGRVSIRLAEVGAQIVGLDLSEAMLAVAREKSASLENARWVCGDIRAFDLGERFGLIVIPGHAFQNLTDADEQLACLEAIGRHLTENGKLVIHVDSPDLDWLGELATRDAPVLEPAEEFVRAASGNRVRASRAWTYERSTQTATCRTVWEEFAANGERVDRWDTGPTRIHCVFPCEMEHLLSETGFRVENVYGAFDRRALDDECTEMIWVARRAEVAEDEDGRMR